MPSTYPKIEINGKTYWQVACKKCQRADRYKIFFDGKKSFLVRCECGNTTEIDKAELQRKPDKKPIPLHMLI